jgi:imidazolonepropionase
MQVEIVHHGGALRAGPSLYALKDLAPLERLVDTSLRIVGAEMDPQGQTQLLLSDDSQLAVRLSPSLAQRRTVAAPAPADLVLHNIAQILTMEGSGVGLLEQAVVACRDGRIVWVGANDDLGSQVSVDPGARHIDARGGVVTPGLVDPHTHPVFAGERSGEFAMKAAGRSYLEIHQAGGGIFSTVRATRAASFEELAATCRRNLSALLSWGVTTCEAKSGYALDTDGEIRLLEVLRTVGECHPVDLAPTLLGAHALPPEFAGRRGDYVACVVEEMIPRAAREGLARFCDVYCEEGAFTPEEVTAIFAAARNAGLGLRLHAEQFTDQRGAVLAAELGAASADHLETLGPDGVRALGGSSTVAVLLPGAALSCRCPWPPARALLDAGAKVALGTDLNPGSSMTSALPLMMSLACMQLRMTCEEVWRAVTVEAARSLGSHDLGRVAPGCLADLVIFEAPDYRYVPYHYGENHARAVLKRGQVVVGRDWIRE